MTNRMRRIYRTCLNGLIEEVMTFPTIRLAITDSQNTIVQAIAMTLYVGTSRRVDIILMIAPTAIKELNSLCMPFGIIHCIPNRVLMAIRGVLNIKMRNISTDGSNSSPNISGITTGAVKYPAITDIIDKVMMIKNERRKIFLADPKSSFTIAMILI